MEKNPHYVGFGSVRVRFYSFPSLFINLLLVKGPYPASVSKDKYFILLCMEIGLH